MIEKIRVICNCGLEKTFEQNEIAWNEDETADCPSCSKKLRFSHSKKPNYYSWEVDCDSNK